MHGWDRYEDKHAKPAAKYPLWHEQSDTEQTRKWACGNTAI